MPACGSKIVFMTNYELIRQHDYDTKGCSVMGSMIRVSSTYEEIISKGESIVPDIIDYLEKEEGGMNIILLLMSITKSKPYTPRSLGDSGLAGWNVNECRQAWLDLYKK